MLTPGTDARTNGLEDRIIADTSLTDWISAITTIGALAAALWAVIVSRRLHQVEIIRDRRSDERSRRTQAAGIAIWVIVRSSSDERSRRGLLLHNSSDAPVFEVEVISTYARTKTADPRKLPTLTLAVLPPGDYVVFGDTTYQWSFPIERTACKDEITPVMNNPGWTVESFDFRDSHGVRWHREGGRLDEIVDET